jgi:transposase
MSGKNRSFSSEFRASVAERILNGESVSAISAEFSIKRTVLYRWRDAYRKEGLAGLQRRVGRPARGDSPPRPSAGNPKEAAQAQIAELQSKVGRQALEIDFLRRAFKRVEESRRKSGKDGVKASMERSVK